MSADREGGSAARSVEGNVIAYPSATILGTDRIIGQHSIVAPNARLVQSMPPHNIAYVQGDQSTIVRPRKSRGRFLRMWAMG